MGASSSITIQEDQNFETYSLIWLDSQENLQAQKQLRSSINHLITFEDDQLCLKYIQSLTKHDRVVFIISGTFGQTFVPKIVPLLQITSIYVYCFNKQTHQQWVKQYPKVIH